MLHKRHPSYRYACAVIDGKVNAPQYVILQCKQFRKIADGKDKKFCIDENRVSQIDDLMKLLVMPKGLLAGKTLYECAAGFQWLFIIAVLCTVYRKDISRRRYETALLEICRKNGKTFLIAVIFILLFLTEPQFSKFYSVAPDGALSHEVKTAIGEIIKTSPATNGKYKGRDKFRVLRDKIVCNLTDNEYIPLNYSNSTLDGKLPSVFLADEVGALPNPYAIEAMRSGQLTILNKLGCIISTKYPTATNPFEEEVDNAKKILDGLVKDDTVFALLYEPDDTANWMTNDEILEQANPLALEVPKIMEDLKQKRQRAIEMESRRENFITKHCNIIYQGIGTESFVSIPALRKCRVKKIDWAGREVYLGVDLAMTTDNCAVAMSAEEDGRILAGVMAFIPEDRIDEKNKEEKIDYRRFIRAMQCIACGGLVVDYAVIEQFVLDIEKTYGVTVMGIAYDRYNALSSAQKWEKAGYNTVVVRQHSDTLHPPTKLLEEKILKKEFEYEANELLELNFQNAKCTRDTNLNRYVNKKKSRGKVDMVVALINAIYLLQQEVEFGEEMDWGIQVI